MQQEMMRLDFISTPLALGSILQWYQVEAVLVNTALVNCSS